MGLPMTSPPSMGTGLLLLQWSVETGSHKLSQSPALRLAELILCWPHLDPGLLPSAPSASPHPPKGACRTSRISPMPTLQNWEGHHFRPCFCQNRPHFRAHDKVPSFKGPGLRRQDTKALCEQIFLHLEWGP